MELDEARPERHETPDERPCDLDLDRRDLDFMLARPLEDRDREVEDVGGEVVAHVKRPFGDDGEESGERLSSTEHTRGEVGGSDGRSEHADVLCELAEDGDYRLGQTEGSGVAEAAKAPGGSDSHGMIRVGEES
jgi:hypothetical protein